MPQDSGKASPNKRKLTGGPAKIAIENVNHPGSTTQVDAAKYQAMKHAFLRVLPAAGPGILAREIQLAVLAHLPDDLFLKGATAGWWSKAVQLDLEAKGLVIREKTKPLRWRRA